MEEVLRILNVIHYFQWYEVAVLCVHCECVPAFFCLQLGMGQHTDGKGYNFGIRLRTWMQMSKRSRFHRPQVASSILIFVLEVLVFPKQACKMYPHGNRLTKATSEKIMAPSGKLPLKFHKISRSPSVAQSGIRPVIWLKTGQTTMHCSEEGQSDWNTMRSQSLRINPTRVTQVSWHGLCINCCDFFQVHRESFCIERSNS